MDPPAEPARAHAPASPHCADALALYAALRARADHARAPDVPLRTALRVLEGAVRLYSPRNLAVAFNGGKDATAVMHLARAVVANAAAQHAAKQPRARARARAPALHCLYLLPAGGADEFPEVERFVRQQVALCGLEAMEVDAAFKDGIFMFTSRRDAHCAFVMGTRRDDPHGKGMEHFEPSSPGWPPFMRVNPILTWSYHDVWRFLRHFNLPYCCMYDRGYTSIGSVQTTLPNPALRIHPADDAECAYRPAWQLKDASLERAGRTPKPKSVDDEKDGKAN